MSQRILSPLKRVFMATLTACNQVHGLGILKEQGIPPTLISLKE